jgi:putative transcriptional regulator
MSSVTKLPDQAGRAGSDPGRLAAAGAAPEGVVVREARLSAAMICGLRRRLGLSQDDFARRYRIPLAMLRRWEAAEFWPDPHAMAYLRAIARQPRHG